jgi:hypothetical protein
LVWIGTDNGRIQVTRDDGKTWSDVRRRDRRLEPDRRAIDASPTDHGHRTYAAVDRHRLDDLDPYVFVTHDYGKTLAPSRRRPAARSARARRAYRTLSPGFALRRGRVSGVSVSFDRGGHWQSLRLDMPRTAIQRPLRSRAAI